MPYPPAASIAEDCLNIARRLNPCRRYSARIARAYPAARILVIVTVRDGRIVRIEFFFDRAEALAAAELGG